MARNHDTVTVTVMRDEIFLSFELRAVRGKWAVSAVLDEDGDETVPTADEISAAVAFAEAGLDETGRDA